MSDHHQISDACAHGLLQHLDDNGVLAYVPGGCIAAATNTLGPAPLDAQPCFVDAVFPEPWEPRRVRIYFKVNRPPKRPKGCQPYWSAYRAEWLDTGG